MTNEIKLKPCPFCGNPAEIIQDKPFDWYPCEPTYIIRCSFEFGCIGHYINVRHSTKEYAINSWNCRRKRNKLTCDINGHYIGSKLKQED